MAVTHWIAGSGDWNTASNWSNGVPTAADDAVFDHAQYDFTVTGSGAAASLSVAEPYVSTLTLVGSHSVGTFSLSSIGGVELAPTAALSFASASIDAPSSQSIGFGATLQLDSGATLGSGTLTLGADATLAGMLGLLANPIIVAAATATDGTATATIAGTGTLSGAITGAGALVLASPNRSPGRLILASAGNDWSGGTTITSSGPPLVPFGLPLAGAAGGVELAQQGAGGTGALSVSYGTLLADPGVTLGPLTAGDGSMGTVIGSDQDLTLYGGAGSLVLRNGSGNATVLGSTSAEQLPQSRGVTVNNSASLFGTLLVSGGTGHVTVFGGNEQAAIYGGTAGGNVLVAGPVLDGDVPLSPGNPYFLLTPAGTILGAPTDPTTIGGGGDGDMLVGTGRYGLLIAASMGNETLSGADSSGSDTMFGGTGSDLVVAGSGRTTVVAGSGAATINGGTGLTTLFAGSGQDVFIGGPGGGYVQAGNGNATLFNGGGQERIGVVDGQSGGNVLVYGFRPGTDHIVAQGYDAAPTVSGAAGGTTLRFSDHTVVTLLGVTGVDAAALA